MSSGSQPSELTKGTKDRNREQNPIIQEKMVSNLLLHLDTCKSMGPNGIHPKVLRKLREELTKLLLI